MVTQHLGSLQLEAMAIWTQVAEAQQTPGCSPLLEEGAVQVLQPMQDGLDGDPATVEDDDPNGLHLENHGE